MPTTKGSHRGRCLVFRAGRAGERISDRSTGRTAGPEPQRRTGRLLATLGLMASLLAPVAARAGALECDGLRRLSDNFLLDLQVRMVFDTAGRRYLRYENAGRGWQLVAGNTPFRVAGPRVVLDPNRYVTSYVERLNGSYYYIDRSGLTLSMWGHCNVVGPPVPLF